MHSNESRENGKLLRSVYEAARSNDWETLLSRFHPDVVLHETPALRVGGTYRGMAEVGPVLAELGAVLDQSTLQVEYICAGEDHAVASLIVQALDGGGEIRLSEHATIRDGQVTEIRVFYWDTGVVNAALDRPSREEPAANVLSG
jgi:ketosteroid isomerase-like protein